MPGTNKKKSFVKSYSLVLMMLGVTAILTALFTGVLYAVHILAGRPAVESLVGTGFCSIIPFLIFFYAARRNEFKTSYAGGVYSAGIVSMSACVAGAMIATSFALFLAFLAMGLVTSIFMLTVGLDREISLPVIGIHALLTCGLIYGIFMWMIG